MAKRPIEAGEEITTDYSLTQMSNTHRMFECKCGSEKCRGVVDPSFDWMREEFQNANAGQFADYIQSNIDDLQNPNDGDKNARLTVVLGIRAADMVDVLFTYLNDLNTAIDSHPHMAPVLRHLKRKSLKKTENLLIEYLGFFAKLCSFRNIDDMGVDRNDSDSIRKHKIELIEFARSINSVFN